MSENKSIGYIVGGGLKENPEVLLTVPSSEIQEGTFVTISSGDLQFYGLVTDLQLGSTDPRFADEQTEDQASPNACRSPSWSDSIYRSLKFFQHSCWIGDQIQPLLDTRNGSNRIGDQVPRPLPVKTIPQHHADVRLAGEGDIAEIFGDPKENRNFIIGFTREQHHPVCIDLDKLVQRSAGVFRCYGDWEVIFDQVDPCRVDQP